jgi:hypothetical protein
VNLSACTVVLRPRTVAEICDLTAKVALNSSAATNLRLAAWTLLPAFVILVSLFYGRPYFDVDSVWWLWLLAFPLAAWLEAPFTLALSRQLFGEAPSVRATFRLYRQRFVSFTWASIVKNVIFAFSGVMLLGFGPFVTWPSGNLMNEASLLEGASGVDAWTRSGLLVRQSTSSFGSAFAVFCTRAVFILGAEALGQTLVDDVLQLGKPFGSLFQQWFTPFALLGLLASVPVTSTMRFLTYIDTRTRADGWDIQVKLMAIAARDAEANA